MQLLYHKHSSDLPQCTMVSRMTFGLLLLFLCTPEVTSAKILFMYYPLFSHIRGSMNLASGLASSGHEVWVALSTKLSKVQDLRTPGVNVLTYTSIDDFDIQHTIDEGMVEFFKTGKMPFGIGMFIKVGNALLTDAGFMSKVKSMNFNLVVVDGTPPCILMTLVPYKLDIPFLYVTPGFVPQFSRTPFNMATHPLVLFPWSPKMDFLQRLTSTLASFSYYVFNPFTQWNAVEIYAPERPYLSMEALPTKAMLWLLNSEPFLDYPRATLPNVKVIGSLSDGIKPSGLPEKYQIFMDQGTNGVVIVSFGSILKVMPDSIFLRLIDAFKKVKYRVIFSSKKKVEVPSRIMLNEWIPQSDLLAHPNTKLLITHCGANGQNEAFLNGVPMLGFPVFAEQHGNAKRLDFHNFGIMMDIRNFTSDELYNTINEVITNQSYAANIKRAAELTRELRTRNPVDEGVFWINHVLKYGDRHLRSYCQDMPLYKYLNLDVIAFCCIVCFLVVYIVWKLCVCSVRKCTSMVRKKISKVKRD